MESVRLQKTLEYLKSEFYTVGNEWISSRDKKTFEELLALVNAINAIELALFDKRITTVLHIH